MLDKNLISFIALIFLLNCSSSLKRSQNQDEIDKIRKGLFMDSYMLSQNALFYNKTFSLKEKEKEKNRMLAEDEITLKDVGFFAYQIGSHTRSFWSYINIFENSSKDRSKYILYPYAFRYKKKTNEGGIEEKEQNKGGFFALNSNLLPSPSSNRYFENIKNISSVDISKSKAIYDIDIGVFTFETKLDGIPINLFSEAELVCSFFAQTLTKVNDCARDLNDLNNYRKNKPNKGHISSPKNNIGVRYVH